MLYGSVNEAHGGPYVPLARSKIGDGRVSSDDNFGVEGEVDARDALADFRFQAEPNVEVTAGDIAGARAQADALYQPEQLLAPIPKLKSRAVDSTFPLFASLFVACPERNFGLMCVNSRLPVENMNTALVCYRKEIQRLAKLYGQE